MRKTKFKKYYMAKIIQRITIYGKTIWKNIIYEKDIRIRIIQEKII